MLDYWEGEARADETPGGDHPGGRSSRLRSYDGLSPQSRSDALRGLWKRIGDAYPEAAQRAPPQRQAASRCPGKIAAFRAAGRAASHSRAPTKRTKGTASTTATAPTAVRSAAGTECARCKNLRHARRAGCKADRAPGRGTQQCGLTGKAGIAHAGRHALQLPAPLRRLLAAQADQKSVLWRTGHRNRYDPERSHPADPRRQGIHRRGHYQRWHRRPAPVLLQPALDGKPLQARGCHFGIRQDRPVSWPSPDEQPRY